MGGSLTRPKEGAFVLDTPAFLIGLNPSSIEGAYSVPSVEEELIVGSLPWVRFRAAAEGGGLRVRPPKEASIAKVEELSKALGEVTSLSKVDTHVLALAIELKEEGRSPTVVTDDYAVQNVASQMGIKFTSLVTLGIKFRFKWTAYCPACRKRYPADQGLKECNVCGTELKRKPLRRRSVKKSFHHEVGDSYLPPPTSDS